jgi:hypothetical protein
MGELEETAVGLKDRDASIAFVDATEAFNTIRDAWLQGRPIVPFLGAGVSVDAGILMIDHDLVDYLAKVNHLLDSSGVGDRSVMRKGHRDHLMRKGWPELNPFLP